MMNSLKTDKNKQVAERTKSGPRHREIRQDPEYTKKKIISLLGKENDQLVSTRHEL